MSQLLSLPTALCLPVPDIESLIQGQTIAALPRMFIRPSQKFALYPANFPQSQLSIDKYYNSHFLPTAQTAIEQLNDDRITIKIWAKCEFCQILDQTKPLDILSQITIWSQEALQEIINKQENIFLAYLRVYHLHNFCEIPINANAQEKLGKFVSLPESLKVNEERPVFNDAIFTKRKKQLENLEPPLHLELEELQSALLQIAGNQPAAQQLGNQIKIFLGWSSEKQSNSINVNLSWIKNIAALGNRSIEVEERKSNYQAGTDFENITRQSLEFLGFKVEKDYRGGAGGLDLYCSQPYPLVVECKAGRLIPSRTVEELIKLGGMHLGQNNFLNAAKLIIGPGIPSSDTQKSSKEWKVSIINAMTLQKLVELKAKYPGAINLIDIKEYLEPGQIDYKIEEYIDKIERQIQLRSDIVKTVKELTEQDTNSTHPQLTIIEIRVHYNVTHNPKLTDEIVHEILIELSSPLTGYLGRIKGEDWRTDRFYYLRDLD